MHLEAITHQPPEHKWISFTHCFIYNTLNTLSLIHIKYDAILRLPTTEGSVFDR